MVERRHGMPAERTELRRAETDKAGALFLAAT